MKTCKNCLRHYSKMTGFIRVRKDYGYCSVECIEASKSPCPNCNAPITRNPGEIASEFIRRRYCSQFCAASHSNSHPKSPEHRQKVIDARRKFLDSPRGKETSARVGKKFSEWLKTEAGQAHVEKRNAIYREWRKSPEGVEWQKRMTELKRTEEYRNKISETLSDVFNNTDRGMELKELYKSLYSGIPRPQDVTDRMKQSLANFYDSPEGIALAARVSIERTNGLPDAPFGPNWKRQRRKAIARDNATCQICHTSDFSPDIEPNIHHICGRRVFGYIPGENENFRWANHIHNLITLCRSCHMKVEQCGQPVPEDFQRHADLHYSNFVKSCTNL